MVDHDPDEVSFDILVRSPASGKTPHLETLEAFRPDPSEIEQCRRHLAALGLTCHPAQFGLAGTVSREVFEAVFATKLEATPSRPGTPPWRAIRPPEPPEELAELIEAITISAPPEFF